jgi:hypothetical protein
LGWLWVFGGFSGFDSLTPSWGSYVWSGIFYLGIGILSFYIDLLTFYNPARNSNYPDDDVMCAVSFYVKVFCFHAIFWSLFSISGVVLVKKYPFFVKDYFILMFFFVLMQYGDYVFPSYARYLRLVREGKWMRQRGLIGPQ